MTATHLDQLVKSATEQFERRFGGAPCWIVAAPGRVNLIGEHIDYNDGLVLPMAIERYCVIAASETKSEGQGTAAAVMSHSSSNATVFSSTANEEVVISFTAPKHHPSPGHWSNYVAGAIAGCVAANMRPPGCAMVIESNVPVGGGLSSSAALEVATATLIEAMTGDQLDPVAKALLCQQAEHEFAGVPCGIMDQFASVMGQADHFMLLDCRSRQVEQIPFADPSITVLIVNTNVKHKLAGGEYAVRRGQCEAAARKLGVVSLRDISLQQLEDSRSLLDPIEFRRARHVVTEIARSIEAATALKAGDWPEVGRLMVASHHSLRDDFEVSCRELDLLVELACELGNSCGVLGSRMTGGGFGGCTVSLVETRQVDRVANHLAGRYQAETGLEPGILTSRPARGAHIVCS